MRLASIVQTFATPLPIAYATELDAFQKIRGSAAGIRRLSAPDDRETSSRPAPPRPAILKRGLTSAGAKLVTAFCESPIDDNLCSDPDILGSASSRPGGESSDLWSLLTPLLVARQLHSHSHDTCSDMAVAQSLAQEFT